MTRLLVIYDYSLASDYNHKYMIGITGILRKGGEEMMREMNDSLTSDDILAEKGN